MNRRNIIALLGGAAAWPVAARAQQPALPLIGYLSSESQASSSPRVAAFRQGLRATGYVDGESAAIEFRWANGHIDQLPALAADLVRRRPRVVFAIGPAALAAKAATSTIPIVFEVGADPVAIGLVAALNRPGGNLTGVTTLGTELGPKRLELLHEVLPAANVVAALLNPTNTAAEGQAKSIAGAAAALGLQAHVLHAASEREIDNAFATLHGLRVGALLIGGDGFFNDQSERLGALAVQHAMPTIYQTREFVVAGGLMGYGDLQREQDRQVGVYVGRILKGENPAELPVLQSAKVELIINLKAAKVLGITVPLALLTRADEVIE